MSISNHYLVPVLLSFLFVCGFENVTLDVSLAEEAAEDVALSSQNSAPRTITPLPKAQKKISIYLDAVNIGGLF